MKSGINPRTGKMEYADSELVKAVQWHPNYSVLPDKRNTVITPHHMAGNLPPEQVYKVFTTRQGSANYCVFNDGSIIQYVKENCRAWTSSTGIGNDNFAVTIEVANSSVGGDWLVSDAALNSLILLMADIAERNGMGLMRYSGIDETHLGDRNVDNVTLHCYFAATACPGPYLKGKMPEIVARTNEMLIWKKGGKHEQK